MLEMPRLFEITQVAEVYADAMVRDVSGDLMFLSCYGRDTAIKELMARIQLAGGKEGLSELTLVRSSEAEREQATGLLMRPKELTYHSGRLPRGLFGQLVHAWIYNPVIAAPDKGAQQAWVLEPGMLDEATRAQAAARRGRMMDRVWTAIQNLSVVPLLDHWKAPVLSHIWDDMVFEMGTSRSPDYSPRLSVPIGEISACRIQLSDQFAQRICGLVRAGVLGIEPQTSTLQRPQKGSVQLMQRRLVA